MQAYVDEPSIGLVFVHALLHRRFNRDTQERLKTWTKPLECPTKI